MQAHELSAIVFIDEFSNFFNIFCNFAGSWVTLNVHHLRLALKHECHSKTAVELKECSPKASQSFSGFSSRFTELHAKLDADALLDFSNNCRQKET
jgi:hypothetical protein